MVINRHSVRLRLTLWYVLLLAVILAAFSAGVYMVMRHHLYNNLDESIDNYSNTLFDAIQYEGDQPTLPNRIAWGDPHEGDHFTRIFDTSGNLTFDDSALAGEVPIDTQAINNALAGESETRSVTVDGDPMRVRTWPIVRDSQITGVLELGLSSGDISDTLNSLLIIMGIAYLVTLITASLGGVFLAGRALSPIDKLTQMARRITAEDLGQRLNLHLPDDEVGRLANTFDEMIARLDDAFRRQQQFTSDASHEIRTPLTIMKGQIDVALQREREAETYRQILQAVNEQVDHLIRLAEGLLTLTRADASQIPLTFDRFKFADAVAGAMEQVAPLAGQRGVQIQLAPSNNVTLWADEDLLLQLLLNLLDNAIKYTPSGGQVTIGWNLDGAQVVLCVQDTGIGISEEHIPHIFDRFYRVDKSRGRAEGGTGLGLAISKWIVEAHGGSIYVESTEGKGTTISVHLPTSR